MDKHTMTLIHQFRSGAEQWKCNDCSRHFIVQWPTKERKYKKIILSSGDTTKEHISGHLELQINDIDSVIDYAPSIPDVWEEGLKGIL